MAEEQKPGGSASSPQPPAPPARPAPQKPAAAAPPPKAPAVMAATPWEDELTRMLKERFGERIAGFFTYVGQEFLTAEPAAVIEIIEFLKLEADFDYLVDITAVDWPKRTPRFDLVYVLYSFARNRRIRIKTSISEGEKPLSAVPVHLTANWLEREVFDMFGIEFEGHPDLRRILMPEEWQGHPLRKDYSILKQDTQWVQENLGIESGQ